ncbi:hypothetical protein LCGC14_2257180 [marine sediment metagenome]|uniref:Uncharacterized protein n=1 Tax=marine sediment metagenome TaxID=412755 RepID=A0A0F9DNB6_9ZZZZ
MAVNKSKILALSEANGAVLVELVTAPNVSETLRISAMEKLTADKGDTDFFRTMLDEGLSKGKCPKCDHINHWLIPEEELNQQGYVSKDEDDRVPEYTDEKNCPTYQQACLKKKCSV